jgi:lactoylglutathione lyase
MPYAINHVHIRSSDPRASAAWYEKYFDGKIVSDREVMPGTFTVSMEIGGPVRLNISSSPEGSSDERASAELNQLGLEHFGFSTEDLTADLEKFEKAGIRVVLPSTEVVGGAHLAYIEGPDDVLIELVESPRKS